MLIRVEQGKGRKDRNAMLSRNSSRCCGCGGRKASDTVSCLPHGWLFPGRTHGDPISTRQINRAIHEAAEAAGSGNGCRPIRCATACHHLLEQDVDIRVIQVLMGHSKLDTTALYARVATKDDPLGHQSSRTLATLMQGEEHGD